MQDFLEKAKELFEKDKKYAKERKELCNVYKIFYMKDQKAFLNREKVKPYINNFFDIVEKQKDIQELNEETKIHTKNKFDNFIVYFIHIWMNKFEKTQNKIAIELTIKSIKNK